jgi:hypothetical protein
MGSPGGGGNAGKATSEGGVAGCGGGGGCAGARWGLVGSGVMIEGWQSVSVCVDTECVWGGGQDGHGVLCGAPCEGAYLCACEHKRTGGCVQTRCWLQSALTVGSGSDHMHAFAAGVASLSACIWLEACFSMCLLPLVM